MPMISFNRFSDAEKGIAFMVLGALIIPVMDALAKFLGGSVSSGQIALSRFGFQACWILPIIFMNGPLRWTQYPIKNFIRASLLGTATVAFFTAVKVMPLAEAIAIFFLEPMILTILSVIFLGERIGVRRVAAIIVGFIGALFVIKPSYDLFGTYALLPLISALTFACYLIVTKLVSQNEHPADTQFWTGIGGVIFIGALIVVASPFDISIMRVVSPTSQEWFLLICLGLVATIGHIVIIYAVKLANASLVAPFQYMEIVSATALGFLIFGDFPDYLSLIGISIIIASGLYILHRERKGKDKQLSAA